MAVKKAVLIRPGNIEPLTERFNPGGEDGEKTPLSVGYFLVAAFDGQDGDYDLLTPGNFNFKYRFTGKKLENDFLEIEPKQIGVVI